MLAFKDAEFIACMPAAWGPVCPTLGNGGRLIPWASLRLCHSDGIHGSTNRLTPGSPAQPSQYVSDTASAESERCCR